MSANASCPSIIGLPTGSDAVYIILILIATYLIAQEVVTRSFKTFLWRTAAIRCIKRPSSVNLKAWLFGQKHLSAQLRSGFLNTFIRHTSWFRVSQQKPSKFFKTA